MRPSNFRMQPSASAKPIRTKLEGSGENACWTVELRATESIKKSKPLQHVASRVKGEMVTEVIVGDTMSAMAKPELRFEAIFERVCVATNVAPSKALIMYDSSWVAPLKTGKLTSSTVPNAGSRAIINVEERLASPNPAVP